MHPCPFPASFFNLENPFILKILIQTMCTCRPSGAALGFAIALPNLRVICLFPLPMICPIVGARFPRPLGWATQPLRIQSLAFPVFPHVSRITFYVPHVAPLGLGYMVAPVFYKHAAPLGLKDSPSRFLVFPRFRFLVFYPENP